jgi:glycosyltransferase involved in cell wall biosynthesis
MKQPLLSVCLITYNQARYVAQAIEGVLMQKVDFDWELIIADDFSTDETREILLKYKEENPALIHLILQEKNVGPAKNWNDLITAPRGKYIAYFEGDDYWTDPNKLQRQVDFLEAHTECSICFHKVKTIDDQGNDVGDIYGIDNGFPEITTIKDLARKNYIPSVSTVFRNLPFIKNLPKWLFELPMGDWPLLLLAAEKGRIGFIDHSMAIYRKHSHGTWSSVDFVKNYKKIMKARKVLDEAFDGKYHDDFFYSEDLHKSEERLMEHYKVVKSPLHYYRSFVNVLMLKGKVTKPWGYYYLLFIRYFTS